MDAPTLIADKTITRTFNAGRPGIVFRILWRKQIVAAELTSKNDSLPRDLLRFRFLN